MKAHEYGLKRLFQTPLVLKY
ncbi:hypothetical protein EMIT0232MI5_130154 [Pseudomonas sp. IT-232MI5]